MNLEIGDIVKFRYGIYDGIYVAAEIIHFFTNDAYIDRLFDRPLISYSIACFVDNTYLNDNNIQAVTKISTANATCDDNFVLSNDAKE